MANVVKAGTNAMQPAAILALTGGAFMIVGGLVALVALSVWSPQIMSMQQQGWPWGGGMMSGGRMWGGWNMMPTTIRWGTFATLSSISVGSGALTVLGGYKLFKREGGSDVTGWSTAILAASIVGLVSMSGFFVGPILGIIGGILGLAKRGH
jgi:hypothetical protein